MSAAFADFRLKNRVSATFNLKLPRQSLINNEKTMEPLGSDGNVGKGEMITPPSAVEGEGDVISPAANVQPAPDVVEAMPKEASDESSAITPIDDQNNAEKEALASVKPDEITTESKTVDDQTNIVPEKFVLAEPVDFNPNPHS